MSTDFAACLGTITFLVICADLRAMRWHRGMAIGMGDVCFALLSGLAVTHLVLSPAVWRLTHASDEESCSADVPNVTLSFEELRSALRHANVQNASMWIRRVWGWVYTLSRADEQNVFFGESLRDGQSSPSAPLTDEL
jgi:hypothetical protein